MNRPLVRRPWFLALLLMVVVLGVYLPVLATAGFIWDDDNYVTANKLVLSPGGLPAIWTQPRKSPQYYPMVMSVLWGEYRLWGPHAFGYHLVNVLLHGMNVVWVWLVLRRLRIPGAFFAAMIFGVHPVMVESVAWITECKNLLSTCFYLLAALAYLRFERIGDVDEAAGRRWLFYGLSLAFFLLALCSKSVTATLPAALLILLWYKRRRLSFAAIVPLVPFVILGGCYGWYTAYLERDRVGAAGADWNFSFIDRSLIAGRAIWFYVEKLLVPYPLVFIYPRWHIDASQAWQYVFVVGIVLVVAVALLLAYRNGRGAATAILFFIVTIFPALGFVNVYPMLFSFVADHFQYLAAVGVLALIAAILTRAAARAPISRRIAAASLLVVILASLSVADEFQYRNEETLWRATLQKNPDAWIAHEDLGIIEFNAQRYPEALAHFERSLALKPANHIGIYANLGSAYLFNGQAEMAAKTFQDGLAQPGDKATHAVIANSLGTLYARQKDFSRAIARYRQSVALDPTLAPAWVNLAYAQFFTQQFSEARAAAEQALTLDPDNAKAKSLLQQLTASATATRP